MVRRRLLHWISQQLPLDVLFLRATVAWRRILLDLAVASSRWACRSDGIVKIPVHFDELALTWR